jgi:hypothetical protein
MSIFGFLEEIFFSRTEKSGTYKNICRHTENGKKTICKHLEIFRKIVGILKH